MRWVLGCGDCLSTALLNVIREFWKCNLYDFEIARNPAALPLSLRKASGFPARRLIVRGFESHAATKTYQQQCKERPSLSTIHLNTASALRRNEDHETTIHRET